MKATAPDLGYAFNPPAHQLKKLAQEKAQIVLSWLEHNAFVLVHPEKNELTDFIAHRMKEQGRFAGLKIQKDSDVYFLKFPLGGKTAVSSVAREVAVYHYLNVADHNLHITKVSKSLETPLGKALLIEYFEGTRLEYVEKTDKIEAIADLIYSLQVLLKNQPVPDEKRSPLLYGQLTHPIHTYEKYLRSVETRVKLCLTGKPPRFSTETAKKIINKVESLRPRILEYENSPVFAHRDFFDKNIIVRSVTGPASPSSQKVLVTNTAPSLGPPPVESPVTLKLSLVDFEHAAIVKNYLLGLCFDLANIVVQWYSHPDLTKKLIAAVRAKHKDKDVFDISLTACLIIQILAKIDYTAQEMTPGGVEENLALLASLINNP